MKLYEIDNRLRDLWEKIVNQEGELTEEDMRALNDLELASKEKMDGYGVIIRETQTEIEECQNEIKRI